jgi:hypothetical protein
VNVKNTYCPYDDHFFTFFHGPDGSFVSWSLLWKYVPRGEFIYTTDYPGGIISHAPLWKTYFHVPEQSYEPDFKSMLRLVPPKYREAILAAWNSGNHVEEQNGVDIDRYNTHIVYGTMTDDVFHIIAKGTPDEIEERLHTEDDNKE